jgi:hypothetical protein
LGHGIFECVLSASGTGTSNGFMSAAGVKPVRHTGVTGCDRTLSDPRFVDRTIGSVAFDVGFGDLSYFNRHVSPALWVHAW